MACTPTIDQFIAADGTMDVSEKYAQLMTDTLAEGSLYNRAKDTMYVQFDNLNISAEEKAKLVSEHVANMTTSLSSAMVSSAIQWAKEERDGEYTLAKIKADTETSLANFELIKAQICKTLKEEDLTCAQVTKTISDSFRQNGYVTEYEADGCRPKLLDETGLVFNQTKQVQGATYQTFADAFRKSGVVQIGTDTQDSIVKGLSGDDAGYTNQQEKNAERQRLAYEDSKRTHVVNGSASMIGQMLAAEIAPNQADVQRWRDAIDFLNTCDPSTTSANCS